MQKSIFLNQSNYCNEFLKILEIENYKLSISSIFTSCYLTLVKKINLLPS